MQHIVKKINDNKLYLLGKRLHNDPEFISAEQFTRAEMAKTPKRFDVINLLSEKIKAGHYLEVGVRDPNDNFNLINIKNKFSVDPGYEYALNPVDFKLTSDEFFLQLRENKLNISNQVRFDIIFIDGLHLAHQVEKDIINADQFLTEEGFIVLHDCNPPTEHHARETYSFINGPADGFWNGTTWKAFVKARTGFYSCCIDTDWGVGILSKKNWPGFNRLENNENVYYDFRVFESTRNDALNLLSFREFSTNFDKPGS